MQEFPSVPFSSCFLSILLLPKASDQGASHYNDLEDRLARAAQCMSGSGVPIVFLNVQTESLLTKVNFSTQQSNRTGTFKIGFGPVMRYISILQ